MKTSASHPGAAPSPTGVSTQTLKRRGLLAAGAAFVAGLVARLTEQPVLAGTDGDVVLGGQNQATALTLIANVNPMPGDALDVEGGNGLTLGLHAGGGAFGVWANNFVDGFESAPHAGVYGETEFSNSYGVWGRNRYVGGGTAVRGDVSTVGTGVVGTTPNGIGVSGQIPSTSGANAIAVYGQNYSTYAGSGPGAGGFGVYGISAKGHGLVGATATSGGAAVVGASNGVSGAYAGAFYGSVVISGAFTVVGGPKSAAVPHPDGSHRRLYCMESPESWFEDFGKGNLDACGRVHVLIDPDFAAVVNLSDYHVSLTEYGDDHGLHVREMNPTGFVVQAKNPQADARFSWRVVARRKDITGERLATVTIPPEPTLPPRGPEMPAGTRPQLQRQR
jgi:hypothetical protein